MTDAPSTAASKRPYSGVAASERAALRRQRFIEAGIGLFGEIGYHATTMRALTAASGLTNRYFYESFETMEDLLVACYEHLMDAHREHLREVLAATPGGLQEQARAGLDCFFEAMSDPHFARITHAEVLGVSPRVDELYNRHMGLFAGLMMEHITRHGGPLAATDSRELAFVGASLAGAVIHAGIMWVRSRYAAPREVVVAATLKVLIGTLEQLRG